LQSNQNISSELQLSGLQVITGEERNIHKETKKEKQCQDRREIGVMNT
jgi:hypothetical protein